MKPALSRPKARAALMQELEDALRRSSAQGVIFGQTVANMVGISGSDLECLDFLNLEGRVTAGRLAEVTGLTTGAITGVVDRLEKAGLVRRERDETDRRKVFIATVPESVAQIGRFYEPMQEAMTQDCGAAIRTPNCNCCCASRRGLQDGAGSDRGAQGIDRRAEGESAQEAGAGAALNA